MLTLQAFESALDRGNVRAVMHNGKLWSVRRNGATKLWKTRPDEFRIPIKIGFRDYGQVTQDNINSGELIIVE